MLPADSRMQKIIDDALAEDLAQGDPTTNLLIGHDQQMTAALVV